MATCYIYVKHNTETARKNCRGIAICCGNSRDLLDEKSKSLLFPGAGVVVTNDWCIIV